MQQQDIVKLCADSLRAQPSLIGLYRLKSSHAHELIAAFFGYNSKNAMLAAYKKYPPSNLQQADFLILPPHNEEVAVTFTQRRKALGINGVDIYDVMGTVSDILHEQKITHYDQHLAEIATVVAKRRLIERFGKFGIDIDQINLSVEVLNSNINDAEASFTVFADYLSDDGKKTQRDSTMVVTFPRVGRVGYKEPHVQETRYTGGARQITNQNKSQPQWPYPAGTLVMRRDTKEIGIVWRTEISGAYGGTVRICTDTFLEGSLVKGEVFPLVDQSIDFIPLRLFMPYGKYICLDGSEVLYNRDYRPLWKKDPDGTVTRVASDLFIEHDKSEGFFGGENLPAWGDADTIRRVGMPILKAWGVENKRPQILDLLPGAIESGSVDILRQKY